MNIKNISNDSICCSKSRRGLFMHKGESMNLIRVMVCGVLLAAAISAQAEMTIVDEGQTGLKGTIVPIKPLPVWTLTAGRTVGQELQAWGAKAGWKVIWSMPKDWSIPASTSFTGDFPVAAAEVIKTLATNGALVRAQLYEGNKTMVVTGPGVAAQ